MDPDHALDDRRVVVTYFGADMVPTSARRCRIQRPNPCRASNAYYEFFGAAERPALVVKKGGTVFTIRFLNGFKAKALDMATVKSRKLELAKAAAAKL